MSKFVSNKTKRIEFKDGEYAEIRADLSWQELKDLIKTSAKNEAGGQIENMLFFLKSWNFKEDGQEVEITKESIGRLEVSVFHKIDGEMSQIIAPRDKKKQEKE